MLLTHSIPLLFYPPIKPYYVGKYSSNTNVLFNQLKTRNNFTRNYDERFSCYNRGQCRMEASGLLPAAAANSEDVHAGIGILEFFEGKNFFITGATGLLGKVLVEKILRSTSVGKIYVLIKAKNKEAAFDRLEHDVINSELFTHVNEKYGQSYVREKVIPIVGDICEPNLGIDYESANIIRKNVDVIIHSAANTTFNERYDVIFDTNVIAPQRLMRFAKTFSKLQLFTHVSTAYVNVREGNILEKAFVMGDDDAVDIADEISLLLKSPTMELSPYQATKFYKNLGQQRAEVYGRSSVYQLCKSMGEMTLNEIRGDIPLLIIRPSAVGSCYREPLPGWVQGQRMFDPMAIAYGKGLLPALFANPRVPLDLIPVDLVVNTMIAAIAKHGNAYMAEPKVYHVVSSVSNPLPAADVFQYLYEYFNASPLIERKTIAKLKFFDNFEEFSKCTRDEIFRRNAAVGDDRNMIRKSHAQVEYAQQLCKIYEFASFFKGRFHTDNTEKLIEEMSRDEQRNFEVDVRNIDWKAYIQKIHLPGLRKHVINC